MDLQLPHPPGHHCPCALQLSSVSHIVVAPAAAVAAAGQLAGRRQPVQLFAQPVRSDALRQ